MQFLTKTSILLVCVLFVYALDNASLLHRQKRFIYYPNGGTFKLVLGFAIPIKLGLKQSAAWGWNLQFQYAEPRDTNSTPPWPVIVGSRSSRTKRDNLLPSDRRLFYTAVENIFNNNGLDGRNCILRAICENSMDSVYHDTNGLYGQLIHIALTPDYGRTDEEIDPDLDPIYMDAKKAGEFGVECTSLYPQCPQGLLDFITQLDH